MDGARPKRGFPASDDSGGTRVPRPGKSGERWVSPFARLIDRSPRCIRFWRKSRASDPGRGGTEDPEAR
jgi:hypothetical protein